MKYYLIFLYKGQVVDIRSFDDPIPRDNACDEYSDFYGSYSIVGSDTKYDQVQVLDLAN